MTQQRRCASVLALLLALLLVGASGCGTPPREARERAAAEAQRLERLADDPDALLDQVREAYADLVLTSRVSPPDGVGYSMLSGAGAWRADDQRGLVQQVGDEVCFDQLFGARMAGSVAASYGAVELDPEPWACSPADFGLNPLATQVFRQGDPRPRLDSLAAESATIEDEVGETMLHVRATGVTDGTDPSLSPYELWVDAELRPVRLTSGGRAWEFDRYAEPDPVVRPAAAERGSYGFRNGPGQAAAKACQQGGGCDPSDPVWRLTWADGRAS